MLGCPSPGSCLPRGRLHTAHPLFPISSRTQLSRASLARLHAAGFPQILDHNQEPVEISEPTDPASFSLRLEEADPLQGNEIILQFLAFGRWDGSSSWCLLQADPGVSWGRVLSQIPPQPTSLLEWEKSWQGCRFFQPLP